MFEILLDSFRDRSNNTGANALPPREGGGELPFEKVWMLVRKFEINT